VGVPVLLGAWPLRAAATLNTEDGADLSIAQRAQQTFKAGTVCPGSRDRHRSLAYFQLNAPACFHTLNVGYALGMAKLKNSPITLSSVPASGARLTPRLLLPPQGPPKLCRRARNVEALDATY
jgi:hypothetical protein